MTRRSYYHSLFDLAIGAELAIAPEPGESVEAAVRRLKLRGAKWKGQDRAYRFKADRGAVIAQRTPIGCNGPLSDWYLMQPGERLLLKSRPTPQDRKKAWQTAEHLTTRYRLGPEGNVPSFLRKNRVYGNWTSGLDRRGRLLAFCATDVSGKDVADYTALFDGPCKLLWAGEWA